MHRLNLPSIFEFLDLVLAIKMIAEAPGEFAQSEVTQGITTHLAQRRQKSQGANTTESRSKVNRQGAGATESRSRCNRLKEPGQQSQGATTTEPRREEDSHRAKTTELRSKGDSQGVRATESRRKDDRVKEERLHLVHSCFLLSFHRVTYTPVFRASLGVGGGAYTRNS